MSATLSSAFVASYELGQNVVVFPGTIIGRRPMAPQGLIRRATNWTGGTTFVGDNTVIGCNVVIYENVRIGKNCLIGDGAIIRENVVIGDNTVIGQQANVSHDVVIGNNVRIMEMVTLAGLCRVDDGVFLAPKVSTSNDKTAGHNGGELKGAHICEGVRVGVAAFILPGITIGKNSLVAAGAGVTKDVPPSVLVMGCPARVVRELEPEECSRSSSPPPNSQ